MLSVTIKRRQVVLHSYNRILCVCVQSCLILWDPLDYNPTGCSIYGIFQAWILEWGAISCSRGSSHPKDWTPDLLHLLLRPADSLSLCHLGSPNNRILFSTKKKCVTKPCRDVTVNAYHWMKEASLKRLLLHDSSEMTFWKRPDSIAGVQGWGQRDEWVQHGIFQVAELF